MDWQGHRQFDDNETGKHEEEITEKQKLFELRPKMETTTVQGNDRKLHLGFIHIMVKWFYLIQICYNCFLLFCDDMGT